GSNHFLKGIDGLFRKTLYIHKIVDHFDVLIYLEKLVGFFFQVVRNCGNGVALINRESNYRRVGFVPTNKGDVCTVQGSDNGYVPALLFKNFLGHVSGSGVWNGIVHMQQINILVSHYVNHGAGQCTFVWRIIEKGVGGYPYFVVENVRAKAVQPYRLLV